MDDTEKIQKNIQLMNLPKEIESSLSDKRKGVDENGHHCCPQNNSCRTSKSLEEPEGDVGFIVTAESNLLAETEKMLDWLSSHVVKVDQMPDAVKNREEKSSTGHDLMSVYV